MMTLLTGFDAGAVMLGEIRSSSRLGELLHAEIDIEEEPADRFEASCVRLYRPIQASSDLPWITEGRLSFRHENGKGKLYISSDHPLRNPVVQIGVHSNCPGGRLWREYTFFASPVDIAAREIAPAPVAPQPPRPAIPDIPEKKTVRTSVPAQPAQHQDTEITRPVRNPGGISPIGVLSTDLKLALQMTAELSAPGSPSEAERDLLRIEYRTLTARNDQSNSLLALTEALLRMQREVSELKVAGERVGVSTAVTPHSSTPTQEPAAVLAPLPAAVTPVSKKSNAAIPEIGQDALPPESTDSIDWLRYAALGVTVLLILLLVLRRRRNVVMKAHLSLMDAPTIIGDEHCFSKPLEKAAATPFKVADQALAPQIEQGTPPNIPSASPEMELAEIMLSFGHIEGAAQTLQEYILANPKEALQQWIRQLEIYRAKGMCTEFEALAASLNQKFNVEIVNWDIATPGEQLEMTLELLPHIRDQIDAMWGTPECLEYLQKLLRDNREGQRNGFSLPVAKEILTLIDLMAAEKACA